MQNVNCTKLPPIKRGSCICLLCVNNVLETCVKYVRVLKWYHFSTLTYFILHCEMRHLVFHSFSLSLSLSLSLSSPPPLSLSLSSLSSPPLSPLSSPSLSPLSPLSPPPPPSLSQQYTLWSANFNNGCALSSFYFI